MKTVLKINGMDCADEIATIERALKPLNGVQDVQANLMRSTVAITHTSAITEDALAKAVQATGLGATPELAGATDVGRESASHKRFWAVVISGMFVAIGLTLKWAGWGPWSAQVTLFALSIIAGARYIAPKAWNALRRRQLDMNVLMVVAVIGAAFIQEWAEAAAVVFLFSLSELLEAYSVARARRAVQSLMELAPDTAWVKQGEQLQETAVEQVPIGAMILIRSGARVPLDGQVRAGASAVNQAPVTGESMPVDKKVGDAVFAGSINGEGSLEVEVTKTASNSTIARMIALVQEAQSAKAPTQKFVDRFAAWYTPAIFVLALLVLLLPPLLSMGSWSVWTYRALVLLVIGCPCALVISTPVSIVSGLTAMARRGVLIKGGAFLEEVGRLKALAMDKTGTITEGKPQVLSVLPLSKDAAEIVRIAASIDKHSDHPLAKAVLEYAQSQGIEPAPSEGYQARTGRGAEATIDGHLYFVGNHRFAHESAVCSDELERQLEQIESKAQSVVIVGHLPHEGCKGEVLGILTVGDKIRTHAREAIDALRQSGVHPIVMLSGDNQRTVDSIARTVGIDEAHGDLLPEQKVERVRQLLQQHRYVGMIGDGVNDAPAMAAASIGIAMGAAGTDTAIETADIALMQDDLSQLAKTIRLGRRTLRIIQTNIAFALGLKAVFLVLAISGHTSLWMAIAADTGATLLVIANALRLLRGSR